MFRLTSSTAARAEPSQRHQIEGHWSGLMTQEMTQKFALNWLTRPRGDSALQAIFCSSLQWVGSPIGHQLCSEQVDYSSKKKKKMGANRRMRWSSHVLGASIKKSRAVQILVPAICQPSHVLPKHLRPSSRLNWQGCRTELQPLLSVQDHFRFKFVAYWPIKLTDRRLPSAVALIHATTSVNSVRVIRVTGSSTTPCRLRNYSVVAIATLLSVCNVMFI